MTKTAPFSGRSVRRFEDRRFLTGTGTYVADINRAGQAFMAVVRSPHAHATIKSVDATAALRTPGIIAVHVEADLAAGGLGPLPCVTVFPAVQPLITPPRYALARGRVRHAGDPVAIVLAETAEAAAVAANELVEVEYEALDAVTSPDAALAVGAAEIWAEAPGNVAFRFAKGDPDAARTIFDEAPHVVALEIDNQRIMAAPMEPRAGIAEYDAASGVMDLICTAQGVHAIRDQLAESVFHCAPDEIRVSAPDVGGGFGLKNFLYPEWALLLWAARRHGRAIKWVAERTEDHVAAVHGRDIHTKARLALDEAGRFLALEADLTANMGAYLSAAGPNASTTSAPTAMGGGYDIPVIHMRSTGVFTNMSPIDAYRGAGKPEANFIIERLIEVAARRCGFDAVALRRDNLIHSFPHLTAQGLSIDCGRFRDNLDDAVELAERAEFPGRRAASRKGGKLRGLGFGCFIETSRGAPQEGAEAVFHTDGFNTDGPAEGWIELRVGTESNGQGHETAYRQIAADRLGLAMEAFRYVHADTGRVRIGFGHGGARTMHMGGGTLALALDQVMEKARATAATLLQADAHSLEYAEGRFTATGSERSIDLAEVALAARNPDVAPDLTGSGLDTFVKREDAPFTFPNGCHAAEVEVDPETGAVTLLRYIMVDDYGVLVNPQLTEGQVHGGVAQGIGQALGEDAAYDPDSGQFLAGSFMDYWAPRAAQMPDFETHLRGVATRANPLGAKGSGQAGCIGAPQTIVHAVLDALSGLGVDHIQMPLRSETVWRAIRAAQEGGATPTTRGAADAD